MLLMVEELVIIRWAVETSRWTVNACFWIGGKGIGGMLRNLIANNPEIFRQVTSQQTMSPMQQSSGYSFTIVNEDEKNTNGGRMG
jgi:hypothetical protein